MIVRNRSWPAVSFNYKEQSIGESLNLNRLRELGRGVYFEVDVLAVDGETHRLKNIEHVDEMKINRFLRDEQRPYRQRWRSLGLDEVLLGGLEGVVDEPLGEARLANARVAHQGDLHVERLSVSAIVSINDDCLSSQINGMSSE